MASEAVCASLSISGYHDGTTRPSNTVVGTYVDELPPHPASVATATITSNMQVRDMRRAYTRLLSLRRRFTSPRDLRLQLRENTRQKYATLS